MSAAKYEFGRHETFNLREGWLSKGVSWMAKGREIRPDVVTCDALGLGRNMVKSLGFWLEATGLAVKGRRGSAELSDIARSIHEFDSHFEYTISAWFAHLLLARRPRSIWGWFFNEFRSGSFDRATCLEAFHRYVRQHAPNQTTQHVLERDVACLLATYAVEPPNVRADADDPENISASPFAALGLLVKHAETGRFEKTTPLDQIPPEAFLACVQLLCAEADTTSLPLTELISRKNSPARMFNIDGDMIDELAAEASSVYRTRGVQVNLLGSTRTITMPDLAPVAWYRLHFQRIGA